MSQTHTPSQVPTAWSNGAEVRTRELPTHIGRYRVISRLGEGSTSEVFLARDDFNRREVAIKRVRATEALDDTETHYQEHFFAAEAALVGRLQHPNVVQIFDAVDDPDGPYLVMEHVPGVTLRRFCRADALLPLDQVVEIGFKCAMALGYMFRLGLIHRDVKPANILAVLRNGQVVDVKLSDFGSVLQLRSDRTQVYRVGSLAYMSPEQLNGDTLDARSDMYSLAAVMYHLISGRAPFEAPQQAVLMQQIFQQAPPDLSELREGVSPKLAAVLHKALCKQPQERQEDWDEFARELADLVTHGHVPRGPLQGVVDSERFSLLRQLEFFSRFGDVELWEVVHRAKWQRYKFGDALFRKGEQGNAFHIVTQGQVEVIRDGKLVATLGPGQSVGEMAYLAPNDDLRTHQVDVVVPKSTTTISFTPHTLGQLGPGTQLLFDKAFIAVLVRRLHAAHETLAHPRRIL